MEKAFFFDMDGTLFDSMPLHARAWDIVAARHGLHFPPQECYRQEGRTGFDILQQLFHDEEAQGNTTEVTLLQPDERQRRIRLIYEEKSQLFHQMGDAEPIPGAYDVLQYLHKRGDTALWIVTGSAQQSLFDRLNHFFPNIFTRKRMITALDVQRGKPAPDPYLTAWQRTGLDKRACYVVENAPLGVRSAKAAGLYTYAVNTGPLSDQDLLQEGADCVLPSMEALLKCLSE